MVTERDPRDAPTARQMQALVAMVDTVVTPHELRCCAFGCQRQAVSTEHAVIAGTHYVLYTTCGEAACRSYLAAYMGRLDAWASRRYCTACHEVSLGSKTKLCGGCRGVRYCSIGCQKKDWGRHKKGCK